MLSRVFRFFLRAPEEDEEETAIHLGNLHYMVNCGMHSGFPPCCVKFFVIKKTWMDAKKSQRYSDKVARSNLGYRYMPCPSCFKKKHVVQVLPCPPGSHCFYVNEPGDFSPLMDKGMTELIAAFQSVRNGTVPINGAVSAHLSSAMQKANASMMRQKLLLAKQKELLMAQQEFLQAR